MQFREERDTMGVVEVPAEALWGAQVHPATRVRDLSDEKLGEILQAAIDVMTMSIEKGGSTDRNYVDAEGKRVR